ncbi:anthocyanidin 3-O-glucosyltransferase 2-like [Cynara cardunculus var. scolymus]|uniref:anthocyanidin 3-O-glucosyltransferase 2-like n=1 Tax=Cynara cardunculus var. scolymus TaxID=59895 RepID=UPI000D62B4F2|nr:anthocyanidin 3-O-glucosyltransferase 2-like [Cynara cardunculus var. scolymus]
MATTLADLIFIPAPVIGHIKSTIEIAKLLVNRDQRISITVLIINSPSGSRPASAMATYIQSLANNSMDRIRFTQLPQDQILPNRDPKAPMTFVNDFINSHCKYVRNVVADMMSQPGSGRLAGFVIDMLCTGMIDVANEFNVPTYVYFTSNAAYLGFQFYIQMICDDHNQDVIELSNSDGELQVPSFVNPVPVKVFPSGFDTKEGLDYVLLTSRKMREAKAIMVNTFLELETHAIGSLSSESNVPVVYPVGPIINLDGGAGENSENDVVSWLDDQPPSSVVFLCFGSLGNFEEVQVKEIAHALERTGHRFLWSLRRPPSPEQTSRAPGDYEDPGAVLPEGFLQRTAGIGKVIGWAPQVAVLAHEAIGGFVSHCGWNSVLESLWFGVPLATWPIYAEQQMNAFEMVVELGLAVEIKLDYKKDLFNPDSDIVTGEEIEKGIRQLMDDKEVRAKMKEIGRKSRATVKEGGSSYASVGRIIEDFISNISSS